MPGVRLRAAGVGWQTSVWGSGRGILAAAWCPWLRATTARLCPQDKGRVPSWLAPTHAVAPPHWVVERRTWAVCPGPGACGGVAPGRAHLALTSSCLPGVARGAVTPSGAGGRGVRWRRPYGGPLVGWRSLVAAWSVAGMGCGGGPGVAITSWRGLAVVLPAAGVSGWGSLLAYRPGLGVGPRAQGRPCARREEPGGRWVDACRPREAIPAARSACAGGRVARSPVRCVPVVVSCVCPEVPHRGECLGASKGHADRGTRAQRGRTRAWSRRPEASAALPPLGAAQAWRSASNARRRKSPADSEVRES